MNKKLTKYESKQIELINDWKAKEPSVVAKSLGIVLSPATQLVNRIIPDPL